MYVSVAFEMLYTVLILIPVNIAVLVSCSIANWFLINVSKWYGMYDFAGRY